ncbi:arylesterase [Actibacterium sp. D379-3]
MAGFLSVGTSFGYGARAGLCKLAQAFAAVILLSSPALADPVTIAALGDSLTQGYGLPQEDGFVPQLETWLTDHGADAVLVNAGVSGDTTAGGLSRIGWTLTDDVDALIVALGGNDVLRGIDPAVSRANLEGILRAAQDKGVPILLVGIAAPGNYGPDYQQAFDAIFPELAQEYGTLHYISFLSAITDKAEREGTMQTYMQPDGIHPSARGVSLIVADMGPFVLDLIDRAD